MNKQGLFFSELGNLLKKYNVKIESFGDGQGSEGSFLYFEGDDISLETQSPDKFEGLVDFKFCKDEAERLGVEPPK